MSERSGAVKCDVKMESGDAIILDGHMHGVPPVSDTKVGKKD